MTEVTKMIKLGGACAKENAPTLFTGLSITGTCAAVYLVAKAQKKTDKQIEEEGLETAKDIIAHCWTNYIPAAIATVVAIGGAIASNQASIHKYDALLAAYALSPDNMDKAEKKVVEIVNGTTAKGKKTKDDDEEVKEETSHRVVIVEPGQKTKFKDSFSGRYFDSSINDLMSYMSEMRVENWFGAGNAITLNDIYDAIGLEGIDAGDEYGWGPDSGRFPRLDLTESTVSPDGTPCILFKFYEEPKRLSDCDRYI